MARTIRRVRRSFWRTLLWLTLDNVSKIATIGTPVVVGIFGWYSTEFWKARDENLATYEKTSAAIGKLSVGETAAQRDALFSIIQLGRPELLKRVSSYIEARINSEMDKEDWQLNFASSLSTVEQSRELGKIRAKYNTLRSDIFQPLLLGAIAAGDVLVAQSIVEAVPSVLDLRRNVRTPAESNSYQVWNLLDHSVRARSEPLVRYFLGKRVPARFWTVNLAIDARDDTILDLVAKVLPREFPVVWEVWEYAAKTATPAQIKILAANDLGKAATGTPINRTPIISIAANKFRYEALRPLFEAGFSPYAASIDQRQDVLAAAADAYSNSWSIWSMPEPQPFAKTVLALCQRYIEEGVTQSKVTSELELAGDQVAQLRAHTTQRAVLSELFKVMNVNAIDCVGTYFEFGKLNQSEKMSLLMESAVDSRSSAARLLIDRYGFPYDGVEGYRGETLAMRAASRGDLSLLDFLVQHDVKLTKLDERGKGIWQYAIESEFNDVPKRNDPIFYLKVREFRDLTARLAKAIDVDAKDKDGNTALHLAVKNANAEKIKAIAALKPNFNAITNDGETALSLSAAKPSFYMYLYGLGAREPGRIEDCDVVKKLLAAIDREGYIKQDSPEPTVRASAPKDCLPADTVRLN